MENGDVRYRSVLSSVGWALVILWGLMQAFSALVVLLEILLTVLPISSVAADVIYELFYGAGYLATFMLPVLFLKRILRGKGIRAQVMPLSPSVSLKLPLLVLAGVALCFSAANVNSLFMEMIRYSEFTSEVILGAEVEMAPHTVVLSFITVAVVPAFCEEFLFRGAILENLLPFGRTRAILISAFLFALMHQNAGQLLYTFVAGVVLGAICAYTKSIWSGVIVHLINNFISVLQDVIYARLGSSVAGSSAILLMDCAIYALGAISLCVLILGAIGRKRESAVVFGQTLPSRFCTDGTRGRISDVFVPSVVLYTVLCGVQIALLIVLAMMGGILL